MSPDSTMQPATRSDLDVLWPAVSAAHIFPDRAAFDRAWERDPWRVRIAADGTAAVLERWRDHLDILAIRGLWVSSKRFATALEELLRLASSQGYGSLLSPLIAHEARGGYERAGLRPLEPLVSFRASVEKLACATVPLRVDVTIRDARSSDIEAVTRIDTESFEPFWAYGPARLSEMIGSDIAQVAELDGVVIGYTLSTVERGSGTLGRIAVGPHYRGTGVAHALLIESARAMAAAGAHGVSLCTQQANAAAQALYVRAGMRQVPGRLIFLIGDAESGGR